RAQHHVVGAGRIDDYFEWEVAGQCSSCHQLSIWRWKTQHSSTEVGLFGSCSIDVTNNRVSDTSVRIATTSIDISDHIPERIANLFREANECRQMTWYV